MKKILLTILSATLLLASPAVVVTKKETPQINKHAKITASIESSIEEREIKRVEKAKVREEKIQKMDEALKEKAKIREEEL